MSYIIKLFALTLIPISCQIFLSPALTYGIQNDNLYEVDTPEALENISINPSHFAMGDLTGNGYDDFVFVEEGEQPEVVFFDPDSSDSGFFFPSDGEIDFSTSTYGSIDIIDVTGDGNNEIMFLARTFDSAERMFSWNGESFDDHGIPGSVAQVSFRGNVHSTYADFTGDGTLDKHQGVQQARNTRNYFTLNIFNQDGNGAEQTSGDDHPNIFSFQTGSSYAFDFNNNGNQELYVNSQSGYSDEFYEVNGGQFSFKGGHTLTETSHSYGSAIGDFTNNGYLDIYRANYGGRRNTLFQNNGDLKFEKFTAINTLESLDSRHAMWGDINNNGWLDLTVAENNAATSLYENLEGEDFNKLDREPMMNISGNWRHAIFLDYNRNGRLDMMAIGEHNNSIRLFRNVSPERSWVAIELEQTNTYYKEPIGARLELEAEIGGETITQTRVYNPFVGRFSQAPGLLHFGLDDASSAQLTIHWPSGLETEHSMDDEDLNTYHTISEPEAGNLIIHDDSRIISAALDSVETDSVFVENIGTSDVNISEGEAASEYLDVRDFEQTIAPGETGWIEVAFSPTGFDNLGEHSDSIRVQSDATNQFLDIPVQLQGRTRPVEFVSKSEQNPIIEDDDGSTGSVWGDFTGNGLQDLVILKQNNHNQLYHQISEGEFEYIDDDVISNEGRFTSAGITGDYNRSGHLDLFLGNENDENYLYRNTGDGTFERVRADGIRGRDRRTTGARFTDLTGNGYLDLIVINGDNQSNEIYIYEDEESYNRVGNAGAFTELQSKTTSLTVADFDNSGKQDIITTETGDDDTPRIRVYRQIEPMLFAQETVSGLTDITYDGAGVLTTDLDGSGYLDLIFIPEGSSSNIRIYQNEGDFDFQQSFTSVFDEIESSPSDVTVMDHNRNGFPDLFITDARGRNSNLFFESINAENFLQITSGDMVTETGKNAVSAVALDYNNNKLPDLFISNSMDPNEIFLNDSPSDDSGWIGVEPKASGDDNSILIPGTKVTLTPMGDDATLPPQTQVVGNSSIHSSELSSLIFTAGDYDSFYADVYFPDGTHYSEEIQGAETIHSFDAELTSIDPDDPIAEHPDRVKLYSNYPNPFNPDTQISFDLPETKHVQLHIYDVSGRLVTTLIDETKQAGTHNVKFDASHLTSGAYLAVLNVAGEQHTDKLMLIK